MAQKFLVALDRAHLKIYRFSQQPGQFTPSIQPVDAWDVPPESQTTFLPNHTDMTARFPASSGRFASTSLDGSRFAEEPAEPQVVEGLADRISRFLDAHPSSTWHLAANSPLRDRVIEALPESVRSRLDRVISKDLINVPPIELREHFVMR